MHNKKIFYTLLLLIQTNNLFSFSSFDKLFQQMQNSINELHDNIEQMRKEEKKIIQEHVCLDESSISINDSSSDNYIIITVHNINGSRVDAHITYDDQERPVDMSIETDKNHIVKLNYQEEYRYLTVVITSQKQDKKEQEAEKKSTKIVFNQIIQHGTTLHSDIDFEKASVELNGTTKTITITIPKIVSVKHMKKVIPTSVTH